jgi:hypothetical protein
LTKCCDAVEDFVGERAVVLCVDEMSQVQALDLTHRQITVEAGHDIRDFYQQHTVPAPTAHPGGEPTPRDLLVLSIDATGVNMIDSGLREPAPTRPAGPRPPVSPTRLPRTRRPHPHGRGHRRL